MKHTDNRSGNRFFVTSLQKSKNKTRMHSSRMRIVRNSSRLGGVYLVWGCLVPGGVPGLGGCTWSWGVYLVQGGTWSLGVYLVLGGGTCPRTPTVAQVFSPCGQTHTCKNITFATSLRTVIRDSVIFRWYLRVSVHRALVEDPKCRFYELNYLRRRA